MKHTHALALAGLLAVAGTAQADLQRFGPVTPAIGGYPAWAQDRTGLTLDFGTPLNQSELAGGWLLILPADVPTGTAPEIPFSRYSGEHFYWNATSGSRQSGATLVLALEGAFANGAVVDGDQMVFGRIRMKIPSLPVAGNYKIFTPFGVYDFPDQVAGDKLFFTSDVGVNCIGTFTCALATRVGPFLLPSPVPGGREVPPIPDLRAGQDPYHDAIVTKTPYPNTGRKYLNDPARIGALTGGTCTPNVPEGVAPQVGDCIIGNAATDPVVAGVFQLPARPVYVTSGGLRDPNIFRIEVDSGAGYVELPPGTGTEHDFTSMGRVNTTPVPGIVTVDRASYRVTGGTKADVYATAIAATSPRIPAAAPAQTGKPDLGFYAKACDVDATGLPIAPAGATLQPMFNTGNSWWGQFVPVNNAGIPTAVCVVDNSLVKPSFHPANVTDEIDVTAADFSPSAGTLTVTATPGDCRRPQNIQLRLVGTGDMVRDAVGCGYSITLSNVVAPPTRVTVSSTRGGIGSRDVVSSIGTPVLANVVDTVVDNATIQEDCSATAAIGCAAPLTADVLANDTYNGQPVRNAALAAGVSLTVSIITPPANGTATVDANGNIVYTPNPNFNGIDLVGYAVTFGSQPASDPGYLHISVTPVNDLPVTVNDTATAPVGVPTTLNLLANDTDPDGLADLSRVRITALPTPATATLSCKDATGTLVNVTTVPFDCLDGNVTFTGTAGATTYTYRYRARDVSGAFSALPAGSVSITTAAAEAITVARSLYTSKTGRWQIDGTDNVTAGQTLTIKYDLTVAPVYKVNGVCTAMTEATNPVIGTAVVAATGAWAYDATVTLQSALNPTNTGNVAGFWCTPPRAVRLSSPLGGLRTATISTK